MADLELQKMVENKAQCRTAEESVVLEYSLDDCLRGDSPPPKTWTLVNQKDMAMIKGAMAERRMFVITDERCPEAVGLCGHRFVSCEDVSVGQVVFTDKTPSPPAHRQYRSFLPVLDGYKKSLDTEGRSGRKSHRQFSGLFSWLSRFWYWASDKQPATHKHPVH